MEKSFNDIEAQLQRVLALANDIGGKYIENTARRVNVQHFAQIAARTRTQHGISLFSTDRDEKKPFVYKPCAPTQPPLKDPDPTPEPIAVHTPPEEAHDRMKLQDWLDADQAHRKQLQDGCRHRFIVKMFAELLTDMEICKLEGWDVLEFPRMLRAELSKCFPKPVQLSLFN